MVIVSALIKKSAFLKYFPNYECLDLIFSLNNSIVILIKYNFYIMFLYDIKVLI